MYILYSSVPAGSGKTLSLVTREISRERKKWRRRVKSAQTGESSTSGKTAPRRETRDVYNMQIGTTNPSHRKLLRADGDSLILSLSHSLSLFLLYTILYCVICVNKIYESGR